MRPRRAVNPIPGRIDIIRNLVELARPWQWTKNGVVLAGVIFSGHLNETAFVVRGLWALAAFCLVSSSIYTINDVMDAAKDRKHPDKKDRPVAAGAVSPGAAWGFGLVMLVLGVAAGWRLGQSFQLWLGAFFLVNFLYSLAIKRFVILDVLSIAVSFVIRAIGGVAALWPLEPTLEISRWLLVCTFFLALFLALGKRHAELALLHGDASEHRRSLGTYSLAFLDHLMAIVTAAVVLAYAIYTVEQDQHSKNFVYTLPFVVYGVFYYLHLTQNKHGGGNPSKALYRDPHIWVTTLLWTVTVVLLLY